MTKRGRPPTRKSEAIALTLLGQSIREARLRWQVETGKTVADLCRKLHTGSGTYYAYEGGRCAPPITALAVLSQVLPLRVTITNGKITGEALE